MNEDHIKKIAFQTHHRQFEFRVMLFMKRKFRYVAEYVKHLIKELTKIKILHYRDTKQI